MENIMLKKSFIDKNGTEHNFAKLQGRFGRMWAFLDEDGEPDLPFFPNEKSILDEIKVIEQG